ncbi:unnamed protein product, partial [Meganyctiphanes norvegica]
MLIEVSLFSSRWSSPRDQRDIDPILEQELTPVPALLKEYEFKPSEPSWPIVYHTILISEDVLEEWIILVRRRLQLHPTQAFFLLINQRSLASVSATLAQVYETHHHDDGFLYMVYASQEVFGQ